VTATTPSLKLGGDTPTPVGPSARRGWNATLSVGLLLAAFIVVAALVSFVWTPYDATLVDTSARLMGPSTDHWLGTDRLGRDVLSQLMVGSRTTLYVGVIAVGVAALIGVPLGIIAGMSSGWLEESIMRVNDFMLAFPALLLAIMLAAIFGGSTLVAMIAIGISSIPSFARLMRSGTLQVMNTDFILAARVAGRRPVSIGLRHTLPNVSALIIVQSSVMFAIAILAEAALSYLGLGTPAPTPSWGRMLQESQTQLYVAPYLALFPGLAIALAVLGFNLLGDGLRDMLDPRLDDRR
jgi:peptide/nickel transport system permease protein